MEGSEVKISGLRRKTTTETVPGNRGTTPCDYKTDTQDRSAVHHADAMSSRGPAKSGGNMDSDG
jgi:hypothetical protein